MLFLISKAESPVKVNNYNSKTIIVEAKHNQNKLKYSDVIRLVNSYNGHINEFKINNGSLNVNLRLEGEKEKIEKFLEEIKINCNLCKINSISLEKKNMDELHCELIIDIEFKV